MGCVRVNMSCPPPMCSHYLRALSFHAASAMPKPFLGQRDGSVVKCMPSKLDNLNSTWKPCKDRTDLTPLT